MKEYISFEYEVESGYAIFTFHKGDLFKDYELYNYFNEKITIREYILFRIELLRNKEVWDFSLTFN